MLDENQPLTTKQADIQNAEKKPSTNQMQEKICRICHSSDMEEHNENDELISPCKCKGSIKYVHQQCLYTWRHSQIGISSSNYYQCENCKYPYKLNQTVYSKCANSTFFKALCSLLLFVCMVVVCGFLGKYVTLHITQHNYNNVANWLQQQRNLASEVAPQSNAESIADDTMFDRHEYHVVQFDNDNTLQRNRIKEKLEQRILQWMQYWNDKFFVIDEIHVWLGSSVMSLLGLFHLITFWRVYVDSFSNCMIAHDPANGFDWRWYMTTSMLTHVRLWSHSTTATGDVIAGLPNQPFSAFSIFSKIEMLLFALFVCTGNNAIS